MAQPINRTDLRSRGPGFDSGRRPNVFFVKFFGLLSVLLLTGGKIRLKYENELNY